jgi:Fe-Mn family superoxide dismutase
MKIFDILQEGNEPNISMPKLKFPHDGLEPTISRDTVKFHYDGHTKKYFDTVNELIAGTALEKVKSLDELIAKGPSKMEAKLYNSARQAKNHTFYWDCLTPVKQSGKPSSELMVEINSAFGSFAKFKKEFNKAAIDLFGSGWCWAVYHNGTIIIKTTPDADTVLTTASIVPLFVCDVWEHAYLYDPKYAVNRKLYVEAFWSILDWPTINKRFADAQT